MIRVGTAGWSYRDWEGRVTPRRKPRGFHALAHLARYLNCVEVNSSFYALPRADHTRSWVERVADHPTFRFSAKLFSGFTHGPGLSGERRRTAVRAYLDGVQPLAQAGRLQALLVQFPVSFRRGPAGVARLEGIAEDFGQHPLVLEVRHRSWFDPAGLGTIERLGYSLATIDLPAAPEHPPADVPQLGPLGYLRLHGRNSRAWFDPRAGRDQRFDYLYGATELADLAALTRRLSTSTQEVMVITNNHFRGQAFSNALELVLALEGLPPLAPVELVETFGHLKGRVRVEGQTGLF